MPRLSAAERHTVRFTLNGRAVEAQARIAAMSQGRVTATSPVSPLVSPRELSPTLANGAAKGNDDQ